MVFEDHIVIKGRCEIINLLHNVVVTVMALTFFVIIAVSLTLDTMVRVTVVRKTVYLLVLGVRQLQNVSLLHDKPFNFMPHCL